MTDYYESGLAMIQKMADMVVDSSSKLAVDIGLKSSTEPQMAHFTSAGFSSSPAAFQSTAYHSANPYDANADYSSFTEGFSFQRNGELLPSSSGGYYHHGSNDHHHGHHYILYSVLGLFLLFVSFIAMRCFRKRKQRHHHNHHDGSNTLNMEIDGRVFGFVGKVNCDPHLDTPYGTHIMQRAAFSHPKSKSMMRRIAANVGYHVIVKIISMIMMIHCYIVANVITVMKKMTCIVEAFDNKLKHAALKLGAVAQFLEKYKNHL